ncbi:MAG: hypothetical protein HXX16_17280 [Bacteroidales bacterium]|nr:hypothetical protein [Bacteroidales bacterium]
MAEQQKVSLSLDSNRDKKIFKELVAQNPNSLVAPATIRTEVLLKKGQQGYSFSLIEDTGSSITEKKLARTDRFKVTELGMFIFVRNPSMIGHEVLHTYPNSVAFAAIENALNPLHLEALYNGFWSYTVDQVVFITGRDLKKFRYVSETQQTDANNKSSLDDMAGFCEIEPQFLIDANKKNLFEISVPFSSDHLIAGDDTHKVYVAFIFRGFLISPLGKK